MADAGAEPSPADRRAEPERDITSDCVRFLREVGALRERINALLLPLELTLREYEIMRCLSGRSLSQAALVRLLNTRKVTICRGVQRLHDRGWVSVTRPAKDKRVTLVTLTDPGMVRLAHSHSHVAALLAELHASLGNSERQLLLRIGKSVRGFLKRAIDCGLTDGGGSAAMLTASPSSRPRESN